MGKLSSGPLWEATHRWYDRMEEKGLSTGGPHPKRRDMRAMTDLAKAMVANHGAVLIVPGRAPQPMAPLPVHTSSRVGSSVAVRLVSVRTNSTKRSVSGLGISTPGVTASSSP